MATTDDDETFLRRCEDAAAAGDPVIVVPVLVARDRAERGGDVQEVTEVSLADRIRGVAGYLADEIHPSIVERLRTIASEVDAQTQARALHEDTVTLREELQARNTLLARVGQALEPRPDEHIADAAIRVGRQLAESQERAKQWRSLLALARDSLLMGPKGERKMVAGRIDALLDAMPDQAARGGEGRGAALKSDDEATLEDVLHDAMALARNNPDVPLAQILAEYEPRVWPWFDARARELVDENATVTHWHPGWTTTLRQARALLDRVGARPLLVMNSDEAKLWGMLSQVSAIAGEFVPKDQRAKRDAARAGGEAGRDA